MTSGTGNSAAAIVLAAVRENRRDADAAEARLLANVLAWAELHVTEDPHQAATWGDSPVLLGGEGCPWVAEYTVTELAAALGMSPASGRRLVSDVLELAFRLPRLWAKVQNGSTPGWRARRVAEKTQSLSLEAASFVDAQVAEYADRVGPAQVDRLLDEAIARFMPDLAKQQREAAADQRHLTIEHDQVSFAGTSRVEGELDLADAIDLDTAIGHIAGELKDLGNTLGLDARRALAAGELARRQFAFDYDWDTHTPQKVTPASVEDQPRAPAEPKTPRREMVLYAHLSADAVTAMVSTGSTTLTGGTVAEVNENTVVRVEGHGTGATGHLITLDTLRDWLRVDGDTRVTIRPVLDLNARLVSPGRFASDLQREQLALRDRVCAAPHCNRPARRLDVDHIDPWADPGGDSDEGGPPGQSTQTNSDNLASLCRHHHRAKTFTAWDYQMLYPGLYLWTSPHGLHFLTFNGQTIDLD